MLIFDAHLDLAMNALFWNRDLTMEVEKIRELEKGMKGPSCGNNTVSIPEMEKGKVALCMGTLIARTASSPTPNLFTYTNPQIAYASAMGQLAYYQILSNKGFIDLIEYRDELTRHMDVWKKWERVSSEYENMSSLSPKVGLIIGMEGADPIVEPYQVYQWYGNGLRVLSLTHYSEGRYAFGTDSEGGLKQGAKELLKYMYDLGMCLDLSHLADQAFWEVLDQWPGFVLASHNNCRALVPGQRQFSDEQIETIIARDGIIGVALDAWMLQKGWSRGVSKPEDLSIESIANHIDHISQIAGDSKHVAIGSDLDGGFGKEQTPKQINTIADLQLLCEILAKRGYTKEDIAQVMYENWYNHFLKFLPLQ